MTEESEQPDWTRLPHDPVGFFGLGPSFDHRDLKRQYGQLIRRFKPELFPQEFQRIRAAYETLDLQLRYGTPAAGAIDGQDYHWQAEVVGSSIAESTVAHGAVAPLHERVTKEPPALLYRELQDRSFKTAYDYFSLALISDLVETEDDATFLRWLVDGFANWPQDPGLYYLLFQYLRGPIPADRLEDVLLLLSDKVREDTFFPLTESLWRRLLRDRGFPQFRDTLARCERNLAELNIGNRVTFYIHILKSAMWQADAAWTEVAMTFVEQNFQSIPYQLENAVDLLVALQAYVSRRSDFLNGNPLRAQMDQAMQAYFAEDEVGGDHHVLECQVRMLEQLDELQEAFCALEDPTLPAFYPLWSWLSHDVAERNVGQYRPAAMENAWRTETWALMERVDSLTGWSWLGVRWTFTNFGFLILYALCYLLAPCLVGVAIVTIVSAIDVSRRYEDQVFFVIMIVSLFGGLALADWLRRQIQRRWNDAFNLRMSKMCYDRLWRPEVFSLLGRSHITIQDMLGQIAGATSSRATQWKWLHHYIERDYALAFFAIALRFQT